MTIAQRFSVGEAVDCGLSPEGTAERAHVAPTPLQRGESECTLGIA